MLDDIFGGGKPKRKTIPEATRKKVVVRQKEKCANCGKKLNYGEAHFDHKRPVALGGSNSIRNLQALCPSCHHLKTKEDRAKIAKAKRKERDEDWVVDWFGF